MRKQIAAAVLAGLAMLAGNAALADGMARGSIKDAPIAVSTWSGFYLGAGVGYGHLIGQNNYSDDTPFTSSRTNEGAAGGLGTIVLGFDRQVRERYVVGLFTEFDWSNIELQDTDSVAGTNNFSLRTAYSIGARAGYLMTPTSLLYMTAGYSWANIKSDGFFDIVNDTDPTDFVLGKASVNLSGAFIGLGLSLFRWRCGIARAALGDDVGAPRRGRDAVPRSALAALGPKSAKLGESLLPAA